MVATIKKSLHYKLISQFYNSKVAKRSQVPLINHIDEGLVILDAIGATERSMLAYCIHPMIQNDADLKKNYPLIFNSCDAYSVALAMEYRSVANEFLSEKVGTNQTIRTSPLFEVNDMLVADKVQNRKDFIAFHRKTHDRSKELDQYFQLWLNALEITEETYQSLCAKIDKWKITCNTLYNPQ